MAKVGVSGHRNLPAELAAQISILLRAELDTFAPEQLVGVTCLADGADTLFATEVLAQGGALEVIVPAAEYRDALPESHHADYDRLISQAATVPTGSTTRSPPPSPTWPPAGSCSSRSPS